MTLNRIKKLLFWACIAGSISCSGAKEETVTLQIERLLTDHSDFDFSDPMDWQADIQEAMQAVYDDEKLSREVETLMMDFLLSEASYAAKKAIWPEFANIVSEESLPDLATLLEQEETAVLALLIIQKAELEDHQLLTHRLPELIVIGLIDHFGGKGQVEAIELLKNFALGDNRKLAEAAMEALGKLGDPASADALLSAFQKPTGPKSLQSCEALLQCAENLRALGNTEKSKYVYEVLLNSDSPDTIRAAAILGLFQLSEDSVAFLRTQFASASAQLKPDVIRMVRQLPPDFQDGHALLQIKGLSGQNQEQLLILLADRRDTSIRPYALGMLSQEDPHVRKTALSALLKVASAGDVPGLLAHAMAVEEEEKELTLAVLSSIRGPEVDALLLDRLNAADPEEAKVLMELIRNRAIGHAAPALLPWCEHSDRAIQVEAIKTLGAVGGPGMLDHALKALMQSAPGSRRRAWEQTVYQLALKNPEEARQFATIEANLGREQDPANIVSLLSILGQVRHPAHYTLLQDHLNHPNNNVKIAAIRNLTEWPDSRPMNDLIATFRQSNQGDIRSQALKGALRLIEVDRTRSEEEKLELLHELFGDVRNENEKDLVISGYSNIGTLASLTKLVSLMEELGSRPELEGSIRGITRNVYTREREKTKELILRARTLSSDEEFRQWIDDGLNNERFSY